MTIKQSRYITADTTGKKEMAIRTTELDKVKDDPFVRKSEVQQTVNNSTLPASSRAVNLAINSIELPSLDGYATEEYVDQKLDSIDLSSYASTTYVDGKIEEVGARVDSADEKATEALNNSSESLESANTALESANTALSNAQGADGKAQEALDNSSEALVNANTALTVAQDIDGKAQTALDNSELALENINQLLKYIKIIPSGNNKSARELGYTLEDLKINFPNATSLDDTLDTLAIEQALIDSNAVLLSDGTFYISRSIAIPSNTHLSGSGYDTVIVPADNYSNYMHIITNKAGDYTWEDKSSAQQNECVQNNKGDVGVILSNLTIDCNFKGRSGVCFKNVSYSMVDSVHVKHSRYHGFDIADATEGNVFSDSSLEYGTKPSSHSGIYNCYATECYDDGFTTHHSYHLRIDNCVSYKGSPTFKGSNGFEVDDGSWDVIVSNSYAIAEQVGFVAKCHDRAPAPYNIIFENCTAIDCTYSFWVYAWQTITGGVYHPTAKGVNFNSCTSINPRRLQSVDTRPHYALNIHGYQGVFVNDFKVFGRDVELNVLYPEYSPEPPVFIDGVDVTYDTNKLINITQNARDVYIKGLYAEGLETTDSLIRVEYNGVGNVNLEDIQAVDTIGGRVLSVHKNFAGKLIVNGLSAVNEEPTSFEAINFPSASTAWYNYSISNCYQKGFERLYSYGAVDTFKPYSSVVRHTRFTSRSSENIPPVSASISSGMGWTTAHESFDDKIAGTYIASGNVRHLVVEGGNIWFGEFDKSDDKSHTLNWGVVQGNLIPYNNNLRDLGKEGQVVRDIYLANNPTVTSDMNAKFDIETIDSRYMRVMARLKFRQFKLKGGTSGRTHFGIIAQEWIKACESVGVDPKESGVLVGNEEVGYAIRYTELMILHNAYLEWRFEQLGG